MKRRLAMMVLFLVSAAYDGILGLLFLVAAGPLFEWAEVTLPNHMGYVQFPAALLLIFALMFLAIALRPNKYRHLILYGMLLKVSYCSITFYYWFTEGIPWIWKPFAVIDILFLVLFAWAYQALGQRETTDK